MSDVEAGKPAMPQSPAVPAKPAAPPAPVQISLETFLQVALRVGVIVEATDHPNADRLVVLKVDIGEGAPRQLVAGIKSAYQPSELVGKRVVVVANLKPAMLRGIESQGMVLAAQDGIALALVTPERTIQPGGTVK